jgi:hypothetical protein
MSFNVNSFKDMLKREGARPTLFQAEVTFPPGLLGDPLGFQFMCKAAQLPASTIGTIEVPYFGRKIKVAGDRTFAEWTVTVINDESFSVRNAFERWQNAINDYQGNTRGGISNNAYHTQCTVRQFDKTGATPEGIKTYTFNDMYPSEIGAIDLSWETTDTIEEFTVTLQYNYFTTSFDSKVQ